MVIEMCYLNPTNDQLIAYSNNFKENKVIAIQDSINNLKSLRNNESLEPQLRKINRLIVQLYLEYVNTTHECIGTIAQEINSSDLWKYSKILLNSITDHAEIKKIIVSNENKSVQTVNYLQTQNIYLKRLIEVVNNSKADSNFCILLSDHIYNFSRHLSKKHELKKKLALGKFYAFQIQKPLNLFAALISASRLREFIENFSDLLIKKSQIPCQIDFLREFSDTVMSKSLVLELYALKLITNAKKFRAFQTLDLVSETKTSWRHDLNIEESKDFSMITYMGIDDNEYVQILLSFEKILMNPGYLDKKLSSKNSAKFKMLVLLSAANRIFLKYKDPSFNNKLYVKWLISKEKLIICTQGRIFFSLLQFLVKNFPQPSILHLTPEKNQQEFIEIQSLILIIIIAVAYSENFNPISVFLQNSEGYEILNESFCIGAEPSVIQDYLSDIYRNYDNIKNTSWMSAYSKGGSYVCSDTCDYLYIVGKCGGVDSVAKCPFCGNKIGGTGHEIIDRPGHRNLSDAEALSYLQEKLAYYKSIEAKGFKSLQNEPLTAVRDLKQMHSFHLLNLIPYSIFYYSLISNLTTSDMLQKILQLNGEILNALESSISKCFRLIYQIIKLDESYLWVLRNIGLLPTIIENFFDLPLNQTNRNAFESAYEESILSSGSALKDINDLKQKISSLSKYDNDFALIIEGIRETQDTYTHWQYFRIVQCPSFDSMAQSFSFSNRQEDLKLLEKYIANHEDVQKLKALWPILRFSRLMVTKFSFQISRNEAKLVTVREKIDNDPELRQAFKEFLEVWEYVERDLSFCCHRVTKPDFSMESSIGCFLIENSLNSAGIYLAAAIKLLARIQNNILENLRENLDHQQIVNCSLDYIQQSDIIYLEPDIETIVNECYSNNPSYLTGREIVYEFDSIQKYIANSFRSAKLISFEDFQVMQYQFELLSPDSKHFSVISEIRENIPQKELPKHELAKIYDLCTNSKHGATEATNFSDVSKWLDRALCSARHLKNQPERKIGELDLFGETSEEFFFKFRTLYEIKLKYLISFYEFVELKCYPEVVKVIGENYHQSISFEDKQNIKIIIEKLNEEGNVALIDIINVLKRIVMRMITAELEPGFEIKYYLASENFWSGNKVKFAESVSNQFPSFLKLSQTIKIHEFLEHIEQKDLNVNILRIRSGTARPLMQIHKKKLSLDI